MASAVLALLAPILPDGPGSLGNRRPALLAGGASGTVMAAVILTRLAVTGHRPFRIVRPAWAVA